MAELGPIKVFVEYDTLTATRINELVGAINQLNVQHQQPDGLLPLAATALAASVTTKPVTRRSLLGLSFLRRFMP